MKFLWLEEAQHLDDITGWLSFQKNMYFHYLTGFLPNQKS